MSLPTSWTLINVHGDVLRSNGTPQRGDLEFYTAQVVVVNGVTVFPSTFRVSLDANGHFAIDLPSSNDPDLSNRGWTYRVRELWPGGRTFYMQVLYDGGDINIADVAPITDAFTGVDYTPGPAGPSNYDLAIAGGYVGTEAQWLASLKGPPGADSTVPGPPGPVSTVALVQPDASGNVPLTAADIGALRPLVAYADGRGDLLKVVDGETASADTGNFNFGVVVNNGVNLPGDSRPDVVWSMGFNITAIATSEDGVQPAVRTAFEDHYSLVGYPSFEYHLAVVFPGTNTERRMMTFSIPKDSENSTLGGCAFQNNYYSFQSFVGVEVLHINAVTKEVDLAGPLRLAAASGLLQYDGSNTLRALPSVGADGVITGGSASWLFRATPSATDYIQMIPYSLPPDGWVLTTGLWSSTGDTCCNKQFGWANAYVRSLMVNYSTNTGSGAIAEIASGASTGGWCAQQFTDEGGLLHWTVGRKGTAGRFIWSAADHDSADAEKMGLDRNGSLTTAGPLRAVRLSLADLLLQFPAATVGAGAHAYATTARRAGEATGAGTGIPLWSDGNSWRTYYDNSIAAD